MSEDRKLGQVGSEATGDPFEQALRRAMRREEVRPELTAKLLAIAATDGTRPEPRRAVVHEMKQPGAGRVLSFPRRHTWAGGALAAALLLAVGLGVGGAVHVHEQHERAAVATRKFEQASAIEQQVLEHTRQQLREQGVELGQ